MVQAMDRGLLALASVDHLCNPFKRRSLISRKNEFLQGLPPLSLSTSEGRRASMRDKSCGRPCRRGISLWPDFYSSHFGGRRRVSGSRDDADTLR